MSINLDAFEKNEDGLEAMTDPDVVMAALEAFWHRSDREDLEKLSQLRKRMEAALAAARDRMRECQQLRSTGSRTAL